MHAGREVARGVLGREIYGPGRWYGHAPRAHVGASAPMPQGYDLADGSHGATTWHLQPVGCGSVACLQSCKVARDGLSGGGASGAVDPMQLL
mmetsp:Transcript_78182/g.172536  ORF Transcript_78182/g.172536 Transcript_78182/m.172536 type:complete len:92 (-) Transcript_78182:44-319(-)